MSKEYTEEAKRLTHAYFVDGKEEALNELLLMADMWFRSKMAGRNIRPEVLDDVLQDQAIRVWKASKSFDLDKCEGKNFLNYAGYALKRTEQEAYIQNRMPHVNVPNHTMNDIQKLNANNGDIDAVLGKSTSATRKGLEFANYVVDSTEAIEDMSEFIEHGEEMEFGKALDMQNAMVYIQDAMKSMTEDDRYIINARFVQHKSYGQIGKETNRSTWGVNLRVRSIMKVLRMRLADNCTIDACRDIYEYE